MAFKDYVALPITRTEVGRWLDANGREDYGSEIDDDVLQTDVVRAVNNFDKMLDALKHIATGGQNGSTIHDVQKARYSAWAVEIAQAVLNEVEGTAS